MKELWVNSKPLLDDEDSTLEAERIEFGDDEIIGYNGGIEVFALRGLHFDRNTYEVRDEKGKQVEPDKSELVQLRVRVSTLEEAKAEPNP